MLVFACGLVGGDGPGPGSGSLDQEEHSLGSCPLSFPRLVSHVPLMARTVWGLASCLALLAQWLLPRTSLVVFGCECSAPTALVLCINPGESSLAFPQPGSLRFLAEYPGS